MRALLAAIIVASFLCGFAGCSKKVDWNREHTVPYDKARDGMPTVKGGPIGKGKGKGDGVLAPSPEKR
jgi:hypothetical protein